MNKEYYDKEEAIKNLETYINKDFYNSLKEANFLEDVIEMLISKCIISIDLKDIKSIEDLELVGTLSCYMNDCNDELKINVIKNKKPNYSLINFIGSNELELEMISKIINRIEEIYPNIDYHFGSYKNDNLDSLCKVQALFLYEEK